jgi:predicted dehydrogenase
MENADGAPVSVYLDFCTRTARRELRAWFSHGEITWDILAGKITEADSDGDFHEWTYEITRDEVFVRELEHFFDCVERGTTPVCSIDDGIRALSLVVAAERSSRLRREVAVT